MNYTEFTQNRLEEKYWIQDVKFKFHPPEGTFKKSADEIAQFFYDQDKKDKTNKAIQRITLYKNIHGSNLSDDEKKKMDAAIKKVEELRNPKKE